MKLRELDPKLSAATGILVFNCPCGRCGGRIRLRVNSEPSRDPKALQWKMTGEFPDSLTLTPSINAGCWHGYIRDGEVRRA